MGRFPTLSRRPAGIQHLHPTVSPQGPHRSPVKSPVRDLQHFCRSLARTPLGMEHFRVSLDIPPGTSWLLSVCLSPCSGHSRPSSRSLSQLIVRFYSLALCNFTHPLHIPFLKLLSVSPVGWNFSAPATVGAQTRPSTTPAHCGRTTGQHSHPAPTG